MNAEILKILNFKNHNNSNIEKYRNILDKLFIETLNLFDNYTYYNKVIIIKENKKNKKHILDKQQKYIFEKIKNTLIILKAENKKIFDLQELINYTINDIIPLTDISNIYMAKGNMISFKKTGFLGMKKEYSYPIVPSHKNNSILIEFKSNTPFYKKYTNLLSKNKHKLSKKIKISSKVSSKISSKKSSKKSLKKSLKVSKLDINNLYMYMDGKKQLLFKVNDKITEFYSLVGNNMVIYAGAIGKNNYYDFTEGVKYVKKIDTTKTLKTLDEKLNIYNILYKYLKIIPYSLDI